MKGFQKSQSRCCTSRGLSQWHHHPCMVFTTKAHLWQNPMGHSVTSLTDICSVHILCAMLLQNCRAQDAVIGHTLT